MDTAQIECFVQVAQTLNFRRAAQEMHLSQPTVSKHVAALETELGATLFNRSTRSVELTEAGTAFLEDAREMLRLMYASSRKARSISSGAGLTVAYSDPNELRLVASALAKTRKTHGRLRVSLLLGSRDANLQLLERGQADAVMGFSGDGVDASEIEFLELFDDPLTCIVRKGTRLARLESASFDDVEGMPQVVCLPASLRRRGYHAQGSIPEGPDELTTWCSTTSEALALVDAGFGYALLPHVLANAESNLHKAIPWQGSPNAQYGIYVRTGARSAELTTFVGVTKGQA